VKILHIGDIVGKPGRRIVVQALPVLKRRFDLALVIANAAMLAAPLALAEGMKSIELPLDRGDPVDTAGVWYWALVGLGIAAVAALGSFGKRFLLVGTSRLVEADLRRACRADSAAEASRALAEVGRARWPEGRVRNAGDVGALLGDASLADEIERMSAARFGAAAEPWSGESLWLAYRGALRKARPRAAVHATLPALYPQA